MTQKYVYFFGPQGTEGDATMKNTLGGKGANLAEMAKLNLPVPSGFTISTEFCTVFFAEGRKFPAVAPRRSRRRAAKDRSGDGHEVRRRREPAVAELPQRRPHLDARHDGDGAERRPLPGDDRRPSEEVEERAVRVRRLSPVDHDVLRRGHGEG